MSSGVPVRSALTAAATIPEMEAASALNSPTTEGEFSQLLGTILIFIFFRLFRFPFVSLTLGFALFRCVSLCPGESWESQLRRYSARTGNSPRVSTADASGKGLRGRWEGRVQDAINPRHNLLETLDSPFFSFHFTSSVFIASSGSTFSAESSYGLLHSPSPRYIPYTDFLRFFFLFFSYRFSQSHFATLTIDRNLFLGQAPPQGHVSR